MITISNVIAVAGWVLAPICSGLIVALRDRNRRLAEAKKREQEGEDEYKKLVKKGMKVLLRRELVDAYRDHVTNDVPLTVERFHEISDVHDTYNGFGGNGTGDAMFDGIKEKRMHIVQ